MNYTLNGNPVYSGMFADVIPSNAFGFADPAGFRMGIICPCKPGDTVYSNTKLATDNAGNRGKALVLNYIPATGTEDIPASSVLATLDANDADNSYFIDPSLADAKSLFLQYGWGRTDGQQYDPHYDGNYTYFAQVNRPFSHLPPHVAATQDFSVLPNRNAIKAFAAELLKQYIPLIGKSVIICGDSLIEQSATGQTAYSGAGTLSGNLLNTTYGLGTMQEIALKYNMQYDVRGNGGCCWYPYVNAAADAENRNGCADVDAIIAEGKEYDYCIFAYGYNDATIANLGSADDVADNTTGCGTVAALRYCIEQMQEHFPSTKLLVVMPMYFGTNAGIKAKIKSYYDTISPIIREYHVRTVNMEYDSGIAYGMGNEDGIHLGPIISSMPRKNTEACRRYARCLEAELLKL